MKIHFKTRYNYGESMILPGSPESEALFHLIRRSHLVPVELPWVAKMGFEIEIMGDTPELTTFIKEQNFEFTKGKVKMKPICPTCGKEK